MSFAAVLIRIAEAPALALAFWRCLGGALVLAPFGARAAAAVPWTDRRYLIGSGALLALHFALFIGAFSYTSIASAVTIIASAPIFVALGSWLFLGVQPGRRTWMGLGVALAGTVVIALGDGGGGAIGPNPLLGDAMALGGAVAIAGYLLIGQRARASLGVAAYGTWVYGIAALVLLGTSAVTQSALVGFDQTTWLAILGLLIGPQLLGHTVFNQVMNAVPATTVSVVVLAEPLLAAALGLALLGEVPPAWMALGAPLILAGVYLAATAGSRRVRAGRPPGRS